MEDELEAGNDVGDVKVGLLWCGGGVAVTEVLVNCSVDATRLDAPVANDTAAGLIEEEGKKDEKKAGEGGQEHEDPWPSCAVSEKSADHRTQCWCTVETDV